MIRIILLTVLIFVSGCGGSGGGGSSQGTSVIAADTWQQGGVVRIQQPTGNGSAWICTDLRAPGDATPCGAFILHQGHDCFNDCSPNDGIDDGLADRSATLAAAGFVVYEMQMPPLPHIGPVLRFYQPVLDLVTQIAPSGLPIFMAGLSGGGWTTTVSTAMDSRIVRAYSVSGDAPWYPTDFRCQELSTQSNPEVELCNPPMPYDQLYSLAGVRLLHVYNFNEGGIFAGRVEALGYAYVNDPVPTAHYMSDYAVSGMIQDIRNYLHGQPTVSELRPQGQMFLDVLNHPQQEAPCND